MTADPAGDPVDGRRARADDRPDRIGAQPGVGDVAALADPPEQRPVGDAGGFDVALHGRDRGSAEEPHRAVPLLVCLRGADGHGAAVAGGFHVGHLER
ncbi:MAG: hypothetical protein OXC31_27675 [Spirochaetaceae bacterium]|nr:hypothetical protein [Spirochaetaceae bacterium]